MLSEIGRVVASLDDLDQILARLVEAAAYVTDAEEASIYLADTETDEVVLRATKQAGERQATLQRLRADDMLVGQVFRSGQPILRKPRMDSGPVKVQTGFMVQSEGTDPHETGSGRRAGRVQPPGTALLQ